MANAFYINDRNHDILRFVLPSPYMLAITSDIVLVIVVIAILVATITSDIVLVIVVIAILATTTIGCHRHCHHLGNIAIHRVISTSTAVMKRFNRLATPCPLSGSTAWPALATHTGLTLPTFEGVPDRGVVVACPRPVRSPDRNADAQKACCFESILGDDACSRRSEEALHEADFGR